VNVALMGVVDDAGGDELSALTMDHQLNTQNIKLTSMM
jgi:hypothetical protein